MVYETEIGEIVKHEGKTFKAVEGGCDSCDIKRITDECIYSKSCASNTWKEVKQKTGTPTKETLEIGDVLVFRYGGNRRVTAIGEKYMLIIDDGGYEQSASIDNPCMYTYYQPEPETIEIGGKTYNKEQVLERLAELEVVGEEK